MNSKKIDFRTWAFPTICFLLFCYGMAFIFIYTYIATDNVSLFSSGQNVNNNTANIEQFKEQMLKQIKKIN